MDNTEFDWEEFKEYVNTYDPKNHGGNNVDIIIKDMIYGIGLSTDEKKYKYADGYKKFIEYVKDIHS